MQEPCNTHYQQLRKSRKLLLINLNLNSTFHDNLLRVAIDASSLLISLFDSHRASFISSSLEK